MGRHAWLQAAPIRERYPLQTMLRTASTLLALVTLIPASLHAQGRFDDFETYAPGTPLQNIDPLGNTPVLWASTSTPAFAEGDPVAPGNQVAGLSQNNAVLTSDYSPSPSAFSIRFRAFVPAAGALTSNETMRFDLECPFAPTSFEPRAVVLLDGPSAQISAGGATLPLALGAWSNVELTVDRFGDIAVFLNGDLLVRYDYLLGPQGTYTSTNCASPSGFTFRRQGPSGASYFVDDFQFDILGIAALSPNGDNGLQTRLYGPPELGAAGTHLLLAESKGLAAGQFGYFLASRTQTLVFAPGTCGGRILTNPLRRFLGPGQLGTANANGRLSAYLETTWGGATPASPMAGETWYFQGWVRTMTPTCGTFPQVTSEFTDGVVVTF